VPVGWPPPPPAPGAASQLATAAMADPIMPWPAGAERAPSAPPHSIITDLTAAL
jgi:hypothetical protein